MFLPHFWHLLYMKAKQNFKIVLNPQLWVLLLAFFFVNSVLVNLTLIIYFMSREHISLESSEVDAWEFNKLWNNILSNYILSVL